MATKRISALFYAINGTGLGHLTRLLTLARSARNLLNVFDIEADFHFVTTSEGSEIAWDFPVYKLPSKTVIKRSQSPTQRFARNARLLITNLCASLRPDLLVLDTIPEGAFRELLFLKDFARAAIFVDRHKHPAAASSPLNLTHLSLYDRILIPDEASQAQDYPAPEGRRGLRAFVGKIHSVDPSLALNRQEVCTRYGVDPEKTLLYLSAGGGGDPYSQETLRLLIESVRAPGRHLLVGYGPLYQGQRVYSDGITPLTEPGINRIFSGVDGAISAAGYNSYHELLAAKTPTLFYAQRKGLDLQDRRVRLGAEEGLHLALESITSGAIQAGVQALLERRDELRESLNRQRPWRGALRGAVALLEVASSLERSPLSVTALHEIASWRAAAPEIKAETFVEAARWRRSWRDEVCSSLGAHLEVDEAHQRWTRDPREPFTDLREALQWGQNLAQLRKDLGWSEARLRRFLEHLRRDRVDLPPPVLMEQLSDLLNTLVSTLKEEAGDLLGQVISLSYKGDRLALIDALVQALREGKRDKTVALLTLSDEKRPLYQILEHLELPLTHAHRIPSDDDQS